MSTSDINNLSDFEWGYSLYMLKKELEAKHK